MVKFTTQLTNLRKSDSPTTNPNPDSRISDFRTFELSDYLTFGLSSRHHWIAATVL